MNNNYRSYSFLKFLSLSFILISSILLFTACENFLQGEDVKEEITKTIEYNNAPSYTINVEALKGTGTIKTPATGEVEKKVTDVFPVRFEPEDSCKFIRWEAVISDLKEGESPSDYIQFENAGSLETKVTFKKATASGSVIVIRPVCPPRLTYNFYQDGGEIYPRDSSIEFNFSQPLSTGSLIKEEGGAVSAKDFIAIQNLEAGLSASTYFKDPEINGKRIIFRADTSFDYIPVPNNGQRMISVTIPKDRIWYVNEQYTTPVRVYLDSDISKTFLIGPQTSAKTVLIYDVKQKDDKPIGVLKVDGDEADNKEHSYSVGQSISLRYTLPEGYTFKQWKFVDSKGAEFSEDDLKLKVEVNKEESTNNLALLNITIDNSMTDVVRVVPEIYDPVNIRFVKGSEATGIFKVGNNALTQEEQTNSYAVGKDFTFSYKVPENYFFYDWDFKRTYSDENGNSVTENVLKSDLEKYGIKLAYEADTADSNGFDKATRLAQASIKIENYTDNLISISPICFEHLCVTAFNLGDSEKIYNRDSSIVLTFNKPINVDCKDKITIKIPGLAEDKTFSDYFYSFALNGTKNTITIYAKGGEVADLLPLGSDGTNLISLSANASELYYEAQTATGEKVKVGLENNLSYSYRINAQTENKINLNILLGENFPGTFKVDGDDVLTKAYSVGQTGSFRCKLLEGYNFYGWEYKRTYIDVDGNSKTEAISKESLSELGIEVSYDSEGEVDENGYDKSTRLAQAQIKVKKYTNNIISVIPICFEYLKLNDENGFNLNSTETYERDKDIILTFNKTIAEACKDKILDGIMIPGIENEKSVTDYFDLPILNGNKITVNTKKGNSSYLLPLPDGVSNTISIGLSASDFYYEAETPNDNRIQVGLASNQTFSYRISAKTEVTTTLKFSSPVMDDEDNTTLEVGKFRIDGIEYKNEEVAYSLGTKLDLTYTLTKTDRKDYQFINWKIIHIYNGETNIADINSLSDLNISFSSGISSDTADSIIYGASLTVKGYTQGSIIVQPVVIRIPEVDITINGGDHGISTVTGKTTFKAGESNHIEYKTDAAYAFIRWKLINSVTGNEIEADDKNNSTYLYINSDNLNEEKMDFIVTSVPDSTVKLELQPVVSERPQIISNLPLNGTAVRKDTTIQVMFDYDMSEDSIYYTEPEIEVLEAKYNLNRDDDFLYDDDYERYYGYINDGEYVYKNISIVDCNDTTVNLLSCFEPPVFENPRSLSIRVKRNADKTVDIERYAKLLVTIGENMFYDCDGKNVSMNGSKKWIYQVNDKTDTTGPHYTSGHEPVLKINNTERVRSVIGGNETVTSFSKNGVTLSGGRVIDFVKTDNISLNFEASDKEGNEENTDGAGVASTFTLRCQMLYNEKYEKVTNGTVKNVGVSYNYITGQTAEFGSKIPALYNYLSSGIYSVDLVFRDVCGNETIYGYNYDNPDDSENLKKWYICVDKTAPDIVKDDLTIETTVENQIHLNINSSRAKDYYKVLVKFSLNGSSYEDQYFEAGEEVVITSYNGAPLTPGSYYRFVTRYYDYADNNTGLRGFYYSYTLPLKPADVSLSSEYGNTCPVITASKPETGPCTNMRVRYRSYGSTSESDWVTYGSRIYASSGSGSVTLNSGLDNGKKYEFEICTYHSSSGLFSLPYKDSSGNYPTYTTIPSAVSTSSVDYNNEKNSLKVTYITPNSNYTKYKLIYSTNSDFSNATTETYDYTTTRIHRETITGLSAGTKYYVKVEAYYLDEDIKSVSDVKSAYTMPDKVGGNYNLYIDDGSYDYLDLCWDNPPQTGTYSGYEVYYKLSSASSYTKIATLNSDTYWYYIGESEDGTVLTPGYIYDFMVVTYIDDTENDTVVRNTSYAPTLRNCMSPRAPQNVKAEKLSSNSMKISWTKPGEYFTGYNIRYSTTNNYSNANIINITNKNTTTYTFSNITSDYYYIWVETYVATSSGKTYSNPDNYNYVSTRCSLVLDAVSGLSMSASSSNPTSGLYLSWANPTNTSTYDGIEIWRKTYGAEDSQYQKLATYTDKTKTSYTDTGLSTNSKYTYKVVTYKGTSSTAYGAVKAENEISGRTYSANVTNFSATVQSDSKVTLKWNNPTNSNYYKQIKVYRGSSLIATLAKGTAQYDVTGLTGATSYTFYVKTTNEDNVVSTDYPSGIQIRTNPSTVSGLKSSNRSSDSITLTWNAPSGNYTGYWARYKLSSSSSWTTLGYYSTNTLTKSGLSAGTKYDFDVQAYYVDSNNSYYWSAYTSLNSSTSGAKLTSFGVTGQYENGLYFTWTNLASANYDYVRIWYKKYTASSWSYVDIPKGNTGYTLSCDAGYRYQIQAIAYFNGYGTYTDLINTQTKPSTPTNFAVTSREGVVTVSWTPPSGEQSYRLGYKKSGGSYSYVNISAGSSSYSFGTDINNSSQYSFYMWSKMDYSDFGNTKTSSNTSELTYYTPPPSLPGITVGASTTRWYLTIYNWNSVKSMIPYINVFVDGVYQSGVFNSSTGEIILNGDYENKTITIVPYHCLNSGHGTETIDQVRIYNGGSPTYKTLKTWNGEIYGKRFNVYRLDVNNYYSSTY